MKNAPVDDLNKILTNTLEYQEMLNELAAKLFEETTKRKLKELAEVKKKQSEVLIKAISSLGGDVESTDRITDQESISWISRPLPNTKNMDSILDCLIQAEKKEKEAYSDFLKMEEVNSETGTQLKLHQEQAEANLNYFEMAKQSLGKR